MKQMRLQPAALASIVLLVFAFGFILHNASVNNTAIPPPSPPDDAFILGTMNNADDASYTYISDPNAFGMNLWHKYTTSTYNDITNMHYPKGWTSVDTLFADYSVYSQGIKDILDANETEGMKTLMHRPKIEWLCGVYPAL